MKRKTFNLLLIPAVMLILLCSFSGYPTQNQDHQVEFLLKERHKIITAVEHGELSTEDAIEKLHAIETETLYEADVRRLKESSEKGKNGKNQELPTERIYLKNITKDKKYYQYLTYKLTAVQGKKEIHYYLSLKKVGQEYKLSMLQ